MARYLRLLALQLRLSLATAIAYRANFLIEGATSIAWIALSLLPLVVVYSGRTSVAGWDAPSALVVLAYFTAVHAVIEGVISPSLVDLVDQIRTGAFDYVLLKPVDAQVMISAARYEPWKIFDLLGALAIVVYAFHQRGAPPAALDVGLGVLLFVTGVIATYALWILCAAAAFWAVRLPNLIHLLGSVFDTARWPVQVFSGLWRFVLTFVIPVAVMTTFPAMALLGRLDAVHALATAGGALILLVVSRLVWRTAIRNYTSASS